MSWTRCAIYRFRNSSPTSSSVDIELWAEYDRFEEGNGIMIEHDSDTIVKDGWHPCVIYRYETVVGKKRLVSWKTSQGVEVTVREDTLE